MIKQNELRIGNTLNYTTAENDVIPTTIDWQDLKWLSEDPDGFNMVHDAIPLTEGCLERLPKHLVSEDIPSWIEFVHDLQNWYYYHNEKQELTLKNK